MLYNYGAIFWDLLRNTRISFDMVLYIVGLGLGDEKDITVRGLEAVRRSTKVILEHYTSILGVDKANLVSRPFASYWFFHAYRRLKRIGGASVVVDVAILRTRE